MSKVLITGSSDGLGLRAAQRLLAAGHEVILHARNQGRARDAMTAAPNANGVVVGDLASIAETRGLADQANRLGLFDAVIHNAGVGNRERRIETVDGLEHIFAINVLAPYLLTALIKQPKRLVYLSSGMHRGGDPDMSDLQWKRRRWNQMPSTQVGSPPRWAGGGRQTISASAPKRRSGSRSVKTLTRWSVAR